MLEKATFWYIQSKTTHGFSFKIEGIIFKFQKKEKNIPIIRFFRKKLLLKEIINISV